MLTNKQFAALSKIDAPLTGEMEEFAMFSLDLGDAKAEVGRTPDGTRIVKHLCPSLRGKGVNLWEVTPRREGMTATEFAKFEAEQAEQDRQARLAMYAARGYAFESPEGVVEENDDDPPEEVDEWTRFFADDDTPRGGSGSRRRSGVRSHDHFEGFVDSAQ